jgi:hypothetical protein
MRITALLVLAGLAVAMIVTVAPKASVTALQASAEMTAVDIPGLTRNAKDLPVQQYAAH